MLYKMERVKGMIVGFGFLGLALLLKNAFPGRNMVFLGAIVVFLVVGPTLLSHGGRSHRQKLVKT